MRRVIKFAGKWDAEGLRILVSTDSGVALPGNSYIVTDEQIAALRAEGIPFDEVAVPESVTDREQEDVLIVEKETRRM